ncbi:hypothetical protein EMPG_15209 [Blastomyces silverae]|uniref:Uncharacterized protein n=1 Tax=Blastomyces silverae TaxID=2060906 RepID=A0A0H1BJN1_9EURO|nr:hypothetical protein EMPG_15209 [Blastomyces silverae]
MAERSPKYRQEIQQEDLVKGRIWSGPLVFDMDPLLRNRVPASPRPLKPRRTLSSFENPVAPTIEV